jgi:hypothetical protein
MEAQRNMYKSTAQTEKMTAIENVADPKIIADGKIMAEVKIMADPKILADDEIPAAREKQADGEILAGVEISAPGEIPAAMESLRNWKSKRPAYCLGLAESPTADFSLVPLMSTFLSS